MMEQQLFETLDGQKMEKFGAMAYLKKEVIG